MTIANKCENGPGSWIANGDRFDPRHDPEHHRRRCASLEVWLTYRSFRSLEDLERTGSTARILNLLKIYRENGTEQEWIDKPLFVNRELNTSIIIKHRLRQNEHDRFFAPRKNATKIVIPIEKSDLKTGGRYIFVNQNGFEEVMQEHFGISRDSRDLVALNVMDRLPSLDPFLLRESLLRSNISPASCYFALSDSDLQGMQDFVKVEITPLVKLSMEDPNAETRSIERMADMILSNAPGANNDLLGQTLRLNPSQFQEGVFSWKGFLYYKWSLGALLKEIAGVAEKITNVKPIGPMDSATRDFIARSRKFLRKEISRSCVEVRNTIKIYETAYSALTNDGNPLAFKNFLLEAPALFEQLGEQIGAIEHIVSFSKHRFGPKSASITAEELMDVLMDFEMSLRRQDVGDLG